MGSTHMQQVWQQQGSNRAATGQQQGSSSSSSSRRIRTTQGKAGRRTGAEAGHLRKQAGQAEPLGICVCVSVCVCVCVCMCVTTAGYYTCYTLSVDLTQVCDAASKAVFIASPNDPMQTDCTCPGNPRCPRLDFSKVLERCHTHTLHAAHDDTYSSSNAPVCNGRLDTCCRGMQVCALSVGHRR